MKYERELLDLLLVNGLVTWIGCLGVTMPVRKCEGSILWSFDVSTRPLEMPDNDHDFLD
jgi:hypothetical protein